MGKLWLKLLKDNKIIRDITLDCCDVDETQLELDDLRTEMAEACNELDVEFPVVVEMNRREFAKRHRTDFREDSFIQETDFDRMEVVFFDPE